MDWTLASTLATTVAVAFVTSWGTAHWTARRSGAQKIAESRMVWNEHHRQLSVQLYEALTKLSSASPTPEDRATAQNVATEILLIINPGGSGDSAKAEQDLQNDTIKRLKAHGIEVDLRYVETHRSVLKHAWRTAKAEFQ